MRGYAHSRLSSHLSLDGDGPSTAREIRLSSPRKVSSFETLVHDVAHISVRNADYSLFFRGQPRDYILDSGASTSYPTIYRNSGNAKLASVELKNRFSILDNAAAALLKKFARVKLEGHEKLNKFPELCWAILQHYGVCDTPLLDVTYSLRVAASFALNSGSSEAVLLIYGFAHPSGSISYSVEQELMNIKLLSICPPKAYRPHFQEGFLVGSFPARLVKKHTSIDVCTRLVAKFHLVKDGFWSRDFQPIPDSALYPKHDLVKDICAEIKQDPNID